LDVRRSFVHGSEEQLRIGKRRKCVETVGSPLLGGLVLHICTSIDRETAPKQTSAFLDYRKYQALAFTPLLTLQDGSWYVGVSPLGGVSNTYRNNNREAGSCRGSYSVVQKLDMAGTQLTGLQVATDETTSGWRRDASKEIFAIRCRIDTYFKER